MRMSCTYILRIQVLSTGSALHHYKNVGWSRIEPRCGVLSNFMRVDGTRSHELCMSGLFEERRGLHAQGWSLCSDSEGLSEACTD